MIAGFLSLFSWRYSQTLVYMLQSDEYQVGRYLQWFWRTSNFNLVSKRKVIVKTKAAKLLLAALRCGMTLQIVLAVFLIARGCVANDTRLVLVGGLIGISYPLVWAHLVAVPLLLGRYLIKLPKEKKLIAESKTTFAKHKATKIAVAGSYGKTTMKEILLTILSEGLRVEATPGNKNVAISHALFARKLHPEDDVIIVEFGEGKPGDVAAFAKVVQPDLAVITGLAPAHLDMYKTLENAGKDIFSLTSFVKPDNLFVSNESDAIRPFIHKSFQEYDKHQVDDWKISDIETQITGTTFTMTKAKTTLKLHSGLIGEHLVASVGCGVAIGKRLGLSNKQITSGVQKTVPFEHRMQPRPLAGGWIIDDTYNGTIEGMRAGLQLLTQLKANRKVYVTPGLVDQGQDSHKIHKQLGEHIAAAKPDKVVLMKNSVTDWILEGISDGGYTGEISVQDDPLRFYTNIDQVMAAGDVVMMQNDWPDNYR